MPNKTRWQDDLIIALAMLMLVAVFISAAKPPKAPPAAGWGKKMNGEIRYRAKTATGGE